MEIMDYEKKNQSIMQSELNRSADGLQFRKLDQKTMVEQSVGFSKQGQIEYEGEFKNGKPEGAWTTFFPDGRPRWKGLKKNGLNHGPYKMWYPDGRKKMEGTFFNGEKQGRSIAWHPNGVKLLEQWHEQGVPTGVWKRWDSTGSLTEEIKKLPPNSPGVDNSILR